MQNKKLVKIKKLNVKNGRLGQDCCLRQIYNQKVNGKCAIYIKVSVDHRIPYLRQDIA